MALTGRTAVVYDAHDYSPVAKTKDPHGHSDDCPCDPVCECGSGKDAFIHTEEATRVGSVVVAEASDAAVGAELAAAE